MQLWNEFIAGSDIAYKTIYDTHIQSLYKFGLNFTRDEDLIQDCVHDLFIDLHKYRSRLKKTNNIKTYLFISLKRKIIRVLEKEGKHMQLNAENLPFFYSLTNEDEAENELKNRRFELIEKAMAELSNRQRDTIMIEHLWEFVSIPPSEGVRTNDWKYFRYVNDQSREELYNLKKDPKEIDNLAKKPEFQKELKTLRNEMDVLAKKYADPYSGIPSGLMVEYIREPKNVAINDSKPEYSWVVPKEAVFQNAYQILVASSKANIENNLGDVWNSGQVRGKVSTNVEHTGKPLNPNSKYFWKVRIWDRDNRLSEYSVFQEFKTGTFTGNISTGNSFHIERINPKKIEKTGADSYFVDFGKDAFGTLELD
ncbi:MAG: DUF4976 domain-containing protein [Bacteroidota bacterium]|nr:DUF4976 domain-containing protein [Bacteroidota bacterium]